jgi:hypothetical protein
MWYFDRDNILGLARWLKQEGQWDGAGGIGNLIYYFEKPWKYDSEWDAYQSALIKEKENAKKTRV